MARRDPSGPAYDALPYPIYSDGPNGPMTLPAGDSPSGKVNDGHHDATHHMRDVAGPAKAR